MNGQVLGITEICYVNPRRKRQDAKQKCGIITATIKAAQKPVNKNIPKESVSTVSAATWCAGLRKVVK